MKDSDLKTLNRLTSDLMINLFETHNVFKFIGCYRESFSYLYTHPANVSLVTGFIGFKMGLTRKDIKKLMLASILHDLGKARIDKELLNKSGEITLDEFNILKNRVDSTLDVLKDVELEPIILKAISQHHEREDGSGYPDGIAKTEISSFAKIIAIADAFDASMSNKSYCIDKSMYSTADDLSSLAFSKLNAEIDNLFLKMFVSILFG